MSPSRYRGIVSGRAAGSRLIFGTPGVVWEVPITDGVFFSAGEFVCTHPTIRSVHISIPVMRKTTHMNGYFAKVQINLFIRK
jgi:hypothetical protein